MEKQKLRKGMACVDMETRRRIASMGGKAAHKAGTAHEFTSAEAREAGSKGGRAKKRNRIAREQQQAGSAVA